MPGYKRRLKIHLLTIFLICSLCACTTSTKIFNPDVIPTPAQISKSKTSETRALLDQYAKENNLKLLQSGAGYKRVNTMVTKLAAAAGLQGDSFPVYIADAGDTNSFLSSRPSHGDRKQRLEQTLPYAQPLSEQPAIECKTHMQWSDRTLLRLNLI